MQWGQKLRGKKWENSHFQGKCWSSFFQLWRKFCGNGSTENTKKWLKYTFGGAFGIFHVRINRKKGQHIITPSFCVWKLPNPDSGSTKGRRKRTRGKSMGKSGCIPIVLVSLNFYPHCNAPWSMTKCDQKSILFQPFMPKGIHPCHSGTWQMRPCV